MEIVLGVSLTPTAARMVLVEGREAEGSTVDHRILDESSPGGPVAGPDQVLSAILGTRESAAEEGHRLVLTGVAWSDHAAAARLTRSLREHGVQDVVLVSELHAAGALAQAIGRTTGAVHTGLVLVDRRTATLAVVRTDDAAVVKVATRSLPAADPQAGLQALVAPLESLPEPPQAVFLVGSGVDVAALRDGVSRAVTIPVYAPADGELALARGAALAAVNAPVYDAETVAASLGTAPETVAAPFGSAPGTPDPFAPTAAAPRAWGDPEEPSSGVEEDADPATGGASGRSAGREPVFFPVAGGAVATLLVLGVVALVLSLAVSLRPGIEEVPAPGPTGGVALQTPDPAPETIPAPVPVVQQAPRTVVVTAPEAPVQVPPPVPAAPRIPASAPAPAVPAPAAPMPPPAAPAPAPAAPAPVPAPAAPAPVPVTIPIPVVIPSFPVPAILAPLLTPQQRTPVPSSPAATPVQTEPASAPASQTATGTAEPPAAAEPSGEPAAAGESVAAVEPLPTAVAEPAQ